MVKTKSVRRVLQEYSIDELRLLGKNLGVQSPTGMSKEELAVRVLNAMRERNQEQLLEIKRRMLEIPVERLSKEEIGAVNNLIDGEESEHQSDESEDDDSGEIFKYEPINTALYSVAKLSSGTKKYDVIDEDNFEVLPDKNFNLTPDCIMDYKGYLENIGGRWVVILEKNQGVAHFSEEQVIVYGLEKYDTVEFSGIYCESEDNVLVLEIFAVNGKDVTGKVKHEKFETMNPIVPNDYFSLPETVFTTQIELVTRIHKGGRCLVLQDDDMKKIDALKDLQQAYNILDIPTFIVLVGQMQECISRVEEFSNITIVSENDSPEVKCKKILTTFQRVQKYVETGKDVVLIVDDYDGIYDIFECLISNENANYITAITTKFFNLGGKYPNGGSLTIWGFIKKDNLRLIERLKRSSTILVPTLEDNSMDIKNIKSKLADFYLDEEAKTVTEDMRKVLESKENFKYIGAMQQLSMLERITKEDLLRIILNF